MVKITLKFKNQFKAYLKHYRLSRFYYQSGWTNILAAIGGILIVALYGFPLKLKDLLVYISYFGFVLNLVFAFFNFRKYAFLRKTLKIKK